MRLFFIYRRLGNTVTALVATHSTIFFRMVKEKMIEQRDGEKSGSLDSFQATLSHGIIKVYSAIQFY